MLVDSVWRVFCKWDLDKCGAISQGVLLKVLTEIADMSEEAIHVLFEHVDSDANGSIDYEEFSNWLFSSGLPSSTALLQECRCPDGHEFSIFAPDVDGWCCEECGDDLDVHQEALKCAECAGLCWCIKCTVQQTDVEIVEALALVAARTVAATHAPCTAKEVEAANDEGEEQFEEPMPDEVSDGDNGEACPPIAAEPTEGPVQLNICGLAGLLCTMEVDRQCTVLQAKNAIEANTGIAESAQSLIFDFLALQDNDVLGTLQIPDGAQIILLRRSELQTKWLTRVRGAEILRRQVLASAPQEVCEDRLIVLEAVSRSGENFQYASSDLKADREIALAAARTNPPALTFAAPKLLADREFGLEAVKCNGWLLGYLAEHLRADSEIVTVAVQGAGPALKFAAEELLDDQDIVDLAVEQGFRLGRHRFEDRFTDRKTVVRSAVRRDRREIQYASQRLRSDRWFAMELLKEDPWHLRNIAKALTADHEVVAAALDAGFSLCDAPEKLRANPDVVYLTVQKRGNELMYASQELCANRRIVSAALRNCGMALQYVAFQLRNERKIVEVAVKQDMSAINYAGAHLRNVGWD